MRSGFYRPARISLSKTPLVDLVWVYPERDSRYLMTESISCLRGSRDE
jgi:hypothetical protein